jgi:hypothetical protein
MMQVTTTGSLTQKTVPLRALGISVYMPITKRRCGLCQLIIMGVVAQSCTSGLWSATSVPAKPNRTPKLEDFEYEGMRRRYD